MENQIVKKILEDAESSASYIVSSAQKASEVRIAKVKAELDAEKEATISRVQKRSEQESIQRANLAKALERRNQLAQRQEAISQVFDGVRKSISSFPAKELQKLVGGLVTRFGKDGDTVIIAKADEAKLPASFFSGLKVKGLKREVSTKIASGIILENARTETRLTLDEILATLREKTELEVSRQLL